MTRVFRWGYLVPRLVLLVLAFTFSEFGAGLLLKHYLQGGGQAAVGAKVEVGHAQASLLRTQATLGKVAVADPRDPMTNLLEAERLTLDFDSAAALRKKAVVKQGELAGLRFGTPRETSGELPVKEIDEESSTNGFTLSGVAGSMVSEEWLRQVRKRLSADLQLESVRVAKELRAKWPTEYSKLESRAKQLRIEIETLTAQINEARENPLRHVEFLKSVPGRVASLKKDLVEVEARLSALPEEVQADRARALAARQHDEKMLREKLSFDSMDAESLSAYLLGEQVSGPVAELVGWLRWARKLAPAGDKKVERARSRGVGVAFAGCRQTPNLLIQSLKLSGASRLAGRPLEFRGELTGFTTEPRLYGKPMRLSLAATGAAPIEVRATIDRTGDTPVDELIADCPALALPRLELGKPDLLGLSVAPSTAAVSVSLMLTGERVSGDLQLVQRNVRVTPHVKNSLSNVLGSVNLERSLASRLSQTPQLVTSVTLSGELDNPQWKVWSTAGPAVAEAMQSALSDLAAERTKSLLAKGERSVADELAALDRELSQMSALVTAALDEPARALESLAGGTSGLGAIGNRLAPVGTLFK